LAPNLIEDYFTVTLSSAIPIAAQYADPLPNSVFRDHLVASEHKTAIDPAPPASPMSEPVVAPPKALPLPPSYCVTCIPCNSLAIEPQPSPTVDSATPVSTLDDSDNDDTWQFNHFTPEALRPPTSGLGHMHSHRVNDMHKYVLGVFSLHLAPEIDSWSIFFLVQASQSQQVHLFYPIPARLLNAIKAFLSTLDVVQSSTDSERSRRLSDLPLETCDELLRDHLSMSLYGAALHSKAPPIEWHLQLSQLKRLHALNTGDLSSALNTAAAPEDAYTDPIYSK
jgi:hypothetical protein